MKYLLFPFLFIVTTQLFSQGTDSLKYEYELKSQTYINTCPLSIGVNKGAALEFCWSDSKPLDCWKCAKKIKQGDKVVLETFQRYIPRNPGTTRIRKEAVLVHLDCKNPRIEKASTLN